MVATVPSPSLWHQGRYMNCQSHRPAGTSAGCTRVGRRRLRPYQSCLAPAHLEPGQSPGDPAAATRGAADILPGSISMDREQRARRVERLWARLEEWRAIAWQVEAATRIKERSLLHGRPLPRNHSRSDQNQQALVVRLEHERTERRQHQGYGVRSPVRRDFLGGKFSIADVTSPVAGRICIEYFSP